MKLSRPFLSFFLVSLIATGGFPLSAKAVSQGDLVKCPDFSAVYYLAPNGTRAVFPNDKVYFSWYEDFSTVQTISCADLATYPIGALIPYRAGTRLIKITSLNDVYAVEPGGYLRKIVSENDAVQLFGVNWAQKVDDVNDAFWPSYTRGADLAENEYALGSVIRDATNGTYYLYTDSGWKRLLGTQATKALRDFAPNVQTLPFTGSVLDATQIDLQRFTTPSIAPLLVIDVPVTTSPLNLTTNVTKVLVGDSYRLNWEKGNADEYLVYRSTNQQFLEPSLMTRTSDTTFLYTETLESNATYYWRIVAVKDGVESAPSNVVSVLVRRYAEVTGVLDINQPGANTFDAFLESFSTPIALASIFDYHIKNTPSAQNIALPNDVKRLADYLAWFMNTNAEGWSERTNTEARGTYAVDIIPGINAFLAWDGLVGDRVTKLLPTATYPNKTVATPWRLRSYTVSNGIQRVKDEIKSELLKDRPVLGLFSFWNPVPLNQTFEDITFYDWGNSIYHSFDATPLQGGAIPEETWNGVPGNLATGHGVVVIGWLPQYSLTPTGTKIDWIIVQDNWGSTTQQKIALPFNNWTHFFFLEP